MFGYAITYHDQDGDICTAGDGIGPIDFEIYEG